MDNATRQNQKAYDEGAAGWNEAMQTNMGHLYLEKPAMERGLPDDLTGKKVLCIGAGSGEELGSILTRNPINVVATDISVKLLGMAHERYPEVKCYAIDMMALGQCGTSYDHHPCESKYSEMNHKPMDSRLQMGDEATISGNSFDFIYSSLAFHYANDWDHLLVGIRHVLKPGGTLLFSTHHPGYWAKHPTGASHTNPRGVKLTEHSATLPGGVGITYYNHPNTESIREVLTHTGFTVEHAYAPNVVPIPLDTLTLPDRKKYKNLVKTNAETPLFWVVRAHS